MADSSLEYIVNHAFFPPKLPQSDDYNICHEEALCQSIVQSAISYKEQIPARDQNRWDVFLKMLRHLGATQKSESLHKTSLKKSIAGMQIGGELYCYILTTL